MKTPAAIQLYQFPISHYCEKIRWALDYKGIPYQKINCLPGLHIRTAQKLAQTSTVPILKHQNTVIQGSSQIMDYLEKTFPENPLDFADESLQLAAREWEHFADEHIGPQARRIIYHDLLNYPELVIPLFAHEGPWYARLYFKVSYPKLSNIMRKMMKINDAKVAQSKQQLNDALSKIQRTLAEKRNHPEDKVYLVGDRFSRADLSVAALLAPLFLADKYGLNWPKTWPPELQTLLDEYAPEVEDARRWYAQHR